ncbi:MAG: single-stranded DNA-binding protein [Actinomycetota bacterium]
MTSDNSITIVGNVVDEPELRFTPSGSAVANFTVAVNRRYKNREGNWEDKLDGFFKCNCWQSLAENVAESLHKGTRVVVTGRLNQRSWEAQDGSRRTDIEIQVDEVGPSLRWATAQVVKSQRSSGRSSADWSARSEQPSESPSTGERPGAGVASEVGAGPSESSPSADWNASASVEPEGAI